MISVGVTGQAGFMGTYLYNTLGLLPTRYNRIAFKDEYYNDEKFLNKFVSDCDVIIHLAAVNRHPNPKVIYETNLRLVKQLLSACETTDSRPHIIFSSSIQEERDNLYGKSKKEGRLLIEKWAINNNASSTSLMIPNVFGPFGKPYHNSVVATFCHQLTHEETPKILVDSPIDLIYVGDLVKIFLEKMEPSSNSKLYSTISVKPSRTILVSELLAKLKIIQHNYIEFGIIPNLSQDFELNLFNTFTSYFDHQKFFPFLLKQHADHRGSFVEIIKLSSGGQVSFSTTVPGITRGNHFHTGKAERFAVIKGRALIEIRKIGSNKVLSFTLDGSTPSFVDMPVWYTHNIKNIGDEDLFTVFWINKHYDKDDPDTYFEEV